MVFSPLKVLSLCSLLSLFCIRADQYFNGLCSEFSSFSKNFVGIFCVIDWNKNPIAIYLWYFLSFSFKWSLSLWWSLTITVVVCEPGQRVSYLSVLDMLGWSLTDTALISHVATLTLHWLALLRSGRCPPLASSRPRSLQSPHSQSQTAGLHMWSWHQEEQDQGGGRKELE